MKLEGIHHITAITGDAQGNVDFYAGVLGLRMVKKTVNQDDPSVYHLFYADEHGSPGADLTFFEYPGAAPGRPGAGMVYRIVWRVESEDAIAFWEERLGTRGVSTECVDQASDAPASALRFRDPEGLEHELRVVETSDPPLIADHPEVPAAVALQGFDEARAYAGSPQASEGLLQSLGFAARGGGWELRGDRRGGGWFYDPPPEAAARPGGGTVHHIAWASEMDDHQGWRRRAMEGGARPTEVIDRFWFRSIYFREPSGVLFEIATLGPGFDVDEPLEHLGEKLVLPPRFEPAREQIEAQLTPIENPRTALR